MKKTAIVLAIATTALWAAPASATFSFWGSGSHSHYPGCGHDGGDTGGTSGGETDPTGSSSGGTSVPEPGMLGMFGLGLAGLAFARRRRRAA